MRSLYVAVGLALCSSPVLAADFGIGVSVRSDDGWVYVPIDISKNFRLEPSVRYSSRETTSPYVGPAYGSLEVDSLELGIGVFGLQQVEEAAHLYYGGRVAYVDTSITQTSVSPPFTFRDELSQDGYRIGPTVGFEYLFGGHFSVGGEASYMFVELEGDDDSEQSSSGTETRLIFRYMF